jgi:uncharacterized surface protein with fasciclin (FAS1) repeats
MKTFSKLTKFTAMMFLFVSFAYCSDDDDAVTNGGETPNTIADFVAANDNYSSLAAALEVTGLDATLSGTTNYTVFAPDNDAFSAFLAANNFNSLSDVPTDLLTEVLLNHVQTGEIRSSSLSTGYIESMATSTITGEKLSMYINTQNGVSINGVANVETADIDVDNGVIHAVDEVIGLPDITTFATADPTFEILVAALTRESEFTFVQTLMASTDPAPFTVFAPTNDAFVDLLAELEMSGLEDIPTEVLSSALTYHVVANANVTSGDLMDNMEVSTLAGQNFTVNLGDPVTLTDASGRTSTVLMTDIQANNGVIHVIDTVLLPQ